MNSLTLVVLALATWRLSYLVAHERGPFAIMRRLRVLAGARTYNERETVALPEHVVDRLYSDTDSVVTNNDEQIATTELAELVLCQWCNSVWLGILATALNYVLPDVAFWLFLPFALSAVAVIVQEKVFD